MKIAACAASNVMSCCEMSSLSCQLNGIQVSRLFRFVFRCRREDSIVVCYVGWQLFASSTWRRVAWRGWISQVWSLSREEGRGDIMDLDQDQDQVQAKHEPSGVQHFQQQKRRERHSMLTASMHWRTAGGERARRTGPSGRRGLDQDRQPGLPPR